MRRLVRQWLRRVQAIGQGVYCPCCKQSARRFFPAGVVTKRPRAECAYCYSLERHRLIAAEWSKLGVSKKGTALCIAPEEPFLKFLKNHFRGSIITSDLLRTDVDVVADVCQLPFAAETFDLIIINHVLEHVPDDLQAMRELYRVLKPGGRLIAQTPVNWTLEMSLEDPSASPAERLKNFGQVDHVRLYGRDILSRWRRAGWQVNVEVVGKMFSQADIARLGLEDTEHFFHLKKM